MRVTYCAAKPWILQSFVISIGKPLKSGTFMFNLAVGNWRFRVLVRNCSLPAVRLAFISTLFTNYYYRDVSIAV